MELHEVNLTTEQIELIVPLLEAQMEALASEYNTHEWDYELLTDYENMQQFDLEWKTPEAKDEYNRLDNAIDKMNRDFR
jgi:hypothetical protein